MAYFISLGLALSLIGVLISRWRSSAFFLPLVVAVVLFCWFLIDFRETLTFNDSGWFLWLVNGALLLSAFAMIWFSFRKHQRSQFKIRLAKLFTLYKYDYRESWLGFNAALDSDSQQNDFYPESIKALAIMVNSPAGKLWNRRGNRFAFSDHWRSPLESMRQFQLPRNLVRFMESTNWVVDINEYQRDAELYWPLQLDEDEFNWGGVDILVPLRRQNEMVAIVGLKSADELRRLNWEDHDLLKAAGQQMASYIGLYEATSRIYEQKQLEAFNRVSTFVLHDIKNVSAQLELITQNSDKFADNPEFIEDTFATVESASARLRKMLIQLQRKELPKGHTRSTKVISLIERLIKKGLRLELSDEQKDKLKSVRVLGDREQLQNVFLHLDENAKEAVIAAKGDVSNDVQHKIRLSNGDFFWQIEDRGVGMTEEFMRQELFKPFSTTKGNAGMGIGVYQCRYLLRSFDGDLIVESKVGQGTLCTAILSTITEDGD